MKIKFKNKVLKIIYKNKTYEYKLSKTSYIIILCLLASIVLPIIFLIGQIVLMILILVFSIIISLLVIYFLWKYLKK